MAVTVKRCRIVVTLEMETDNGDGVRTSSQVLYARELQAGTGADQINKVYYDDDLALAAGANSDLNLSSATYGGAALALTKLKVLAIVNKDTDTGDGATIGAAASNPIAALFGDVSDTLKLGPGGMLLLVSPVDGYTVASASADVLRLNSTDASSYRVALAGVT